MFNLSPPAAINSPYTLQNYFSNCSIFVQQKMDNLFNNSFRNKVVLWKGIPMSITPNYISIFIALDKTDQTSIIIQANIKHDLLKNYRYSFILQKELQFQGILVSYRLY